MKRYRIRVLPKAEEQLAVIEVWWRQHRRAHPELVFRMTDAERTAPGAQASLHFSTKPPAAPHNLRSHRSATPRSAPSPRALRAAEAA